MNRLFCLLMMTACLSAAPALADTLSLYGYQRPDGAITVRLNGSNVDPYFAAKALLLAQEVQLDIREAAKAWIEWAVAHQRADGRFDRFCLTETGYVACAPADADDAMIAVWSELLVRFAPQEGMPASWNVSLRKANAYLSQLYDKHSGVYQISKTLPVALLMDNVEIYSSLKAVGKYYADHGDDVRAHRWRSRADQLGKDIIRVFWQPATGFRATTQNRTTTRSFYPDQVAEIFPLLADLPMPNGSPSAVYSKWMANNRETWLQQAKDDFPWGMVALIANRMGDSKTVACWRTRAAPFRHGLHWNVVEEALYLAFDANLSPAERLAPAC